MTPSPINNRKAMTENPKAAAKLPQNMQSAILPDTNCNILSVRIAGKVELFD
jgi:hypothetical protein